MELCYAHRSGPSLFSQHQRHFLLQQMGTSTENSQPDIMQSASETLGILPKWDNISIKSGNPSEEEVGRVRESEGMEHTKITKPSKST